MDSSQKSYGQSDDGAVHRLDKLGLGPTNFAVLFLKPASIRPTQRSRRLNIAVTGYEHWLRNTHLLASCIAPWRDCGLGSGRRLMARSTMSRFSMSARSKD